MLHRLFASRYLRGTSHTSVVKKLAFISVFGIGLGVTSMIVVLSVMTGFDHDIENRTLTAQPHLVIQSNRPADKIKLEQLIPDASIRQFTKQDVIIRTIDGVFSSGEAYGVDPDYLQKIGRKISRAVEIKDDGNASLKVDQKKTATFQKVELSDNEVALGYDLAHGLGIFDGDEVTLIAPESLLVSGEAPLYQKVKVKALISTDISEMDNRSIYYDIHSGLKRFHDTASTSQGFEVKLQDPYQAENYKNILMGNGFKDVKSWQDLNAALFYSLKMEKKLMSILLAITVLVSCFSIVSVLFLLVTEKEKEVGMLKALGAPSNQVLKIFSFIGMVLGVLGIGSGTLLGLIICGVLQKFMSFVKLPDVFVSTDIPVKVEPSMVLIIIVSGMVMTLLSAMWPAVKASKITPIQGIQHLE